MDDAELAFTRNAVREVDRLAIERYGMPGVVLMENAGRQVADVARRMHRRGLVLVIAGGGNNGGDGFVAARHLHNLRVDVVILTTKADDEYAGDAKINLDIARAMKLRFIDDPATVQPAAVLDCLLGTGLSSAVQGKAAELIDWMNAQPAPVLAVDLPSGLDCDTGKPLGVAVRATATITFVGYKRGFIEPGASDYTGDVTVADIGAPRELVEELGEPISR